MNESNGCLTYGSRVLPCSCSATNRIPMDSWPMPDMSAVLYTRSYRGVVANAQDSERAG